MKIYVVTKGDYSDYHIITATTDEATAKKIAEDFSNEWGEAEVEIYEDAKTYFKKSWFVRFDTKGHVSELRENRDEYAYQYINRCYFDVNKGVYIYVCADDANSAVKIAAEKRAEFLARKAGIV